MTDDVDYDSRIDHVIHFARYVQIKSIYKLNINKDHPPCGEPGYDFYDSASLDQGVGETLWPHMGFGSEVLHRL
eukprot:12896308-Ditylum_brightwellii.AAC.1